ncbi:MAG: GspH/FimT family pseudopilin [Pseudomonadota bacterium]
MTVEVLVAAAIVLLVGTVAIASFGSTDRAYLRSDTAAVALILSQGRLQALESGQPVTIEWDERARVFRAGGQEHRLSRRVEAETDRPSVRIFPSGENAGFRVELSNTYGASVLTLDWLTGKVSRLE